MRLVVKFSVHGLVVPGESHPCQLPKVEGAVGVAVRVTIVPTGKAWVAQAVEQLKPAGLLETVPEPRPENPSDNSGPPPPELVKQTTFPVINPVTIAPAEVNPPALEFVVTVAETSVFPQEMPVTVKSPVESTVIICGVLEVHTTLSVMSLVTGG